MRSTRKITAVLGLAASTAAALGLASAASASPAPPQASSALYGTWVNTNPDTRSVTQVIIKANRAGSVNVNAFGACTPSFCDWGSVPAITYGSSVSSTSGAIFQTRQAFLSGGTEWSRTTLFGKVVRTDAGLRLQLREMTAFTDGSGRKNFVVNETFKLGAPKTVTKAGVSRFGYVAGQRPALNASALGTWKPAAPSGNLAKLVIGGTTANPTVHGYGSCSPTPCDWGTVKGLAYGTSISSTKGNYLLAPYTFSFKRDQLVISYYRNPLTGAERITVSSYNEFTDGSGRSNYAKVETLVRA